MEIEHPNLTHLTFGFPFKIDIFVNCPELIDFNLLNGTIQNDFTVSCPKAAIYSTSNKLILILNNINQIFQVECNEFLLKCETHDYNKFNLKFYKNMDYLNLNFYLCKVFFNQY